MCQICVSFGSVGNGYYKLHSAVLDFMYYVWVCCFNLLIYSFTVFPHIVAYSNKLSLSAPVLFFSVKIWVYLLTLNDYHLRSMIIIYCKSNWLSFSLLILKKKNDKLLLAYCQPRNFFYDLSVSFQMLIFVQSICTHFSSLSGQPNTDNNQVQNMDLKKAECKKQGHFE